MAREKTSHKPGKSCRNWVYQNVIKSVDSPASLIADNTKKLGRFVY